MCASVIPFIPSLNDQISFQFLNILIKQEETTRLIYSYNEHDPVNETSLFYHGRNNHRGGKSVSLLTPSRAPAALKNEDIRIMDFRMRNVSLIKDFFLVIHFNANLFLLKAKLKGECCP